MAEFDKAWLDAYCKRTGVKNPLGDAGKAKRSTGKDVDQWSPLQSDGAEKRNKYGNKTVEIDGWKFPSEHEGNCYLRFKDDVHNGFYTAMFMQVPFMLPGGVKYVADFVTINPDGTFDVWDAKSAATSKDKVFRIKKKLMMDRYGIDVKEILNR